MAAFISTRGALSLVRPVISRQWYCRGLATVAGGGNGGGSGSGHGGENGTLPLKGIKVLDMTRVLAGVSDSFFFLFFFFVDFQVFCLLECILLSIFSRKEREGYFGGWSCRGEVFRDEGRRRG